jgi:hypothetical protein
MPCLCSDKLPEWMTGAEGKLWQTKIWGELSKKFEAIQPGCLDFLEEK